MCARARVCVFGTCIIKIPLYAYMKGCGKSNFFSTKDMYHWGPAESTICFYEIRMYTNSFRMNHRLLYNCDLLLIKLDSVGPTGEKKCNILYQP